MSFYILKCLKDLEYITAVFSSTSNSNGAIDFENISTMQLK